MIATPLALLLVVSIGTASAWQDAAATWERLAETKAAAHDETLARLDTERARTADAVARGALATAEADGRAAALALDLAMERERGATLVTPSRRTWTAIGASACAGGAVAAVLGLALCQGRDCRSVLSIGGAGVAVAGCSVLGFAW